MKAGKKNIYVRPRQNARHWVVDIYNGNSQWEGSNYGNGEMSHKEATLCARAIQRRLLKKETRTK